MKADEAGSLMNRKQLFMLETIMEKAKLEELRADLDAVAEDRFARIVATGKTIPWQKMRGYL